MTEVTRDELIAALRLIAKEYQSYLDDTEINVDGDFDKWLEAHQDRIKKQYSVAFHLISRIDTTDAHE